MIVKFLLSLITMLTVFLSGPIFAQDDASERNFQYCRLLASSCQHQLLLPHQRKSIDEEEQKSFRFLQVERSNFGKCGVDQKYPGLWSDTKCNFNTLHRTIVEHEFYVFNRSLCIDGVVTCNLHALTVEDKEVLAIAKQTGRYPQFSSYEKGSRAKTSELIARPSSAVVLTPPPTRATADDCTADLRVFRGGSWVCNFTKQTYATSSDVCTADLRVYKNGSWICNYPTARTYVSPPLLAPSCAENGSCYGDTSVITGNPKTTHVDGYTRRDGTYVRGHYRSK